MKSYSCKQKGRSWLSVFYGGFTAVLAIGFFLSASVFGTAIGVGLVLLTASCIFSAVKNEEWIIQVNHGVMTWDYPRWPASKGHIDLSEVSHIKITDSWITVTFADGAVQRLQLIDYPHRFHAYLNECFPNLSLTLRESS